MSGTPAEKVRPPYVDLIERAQSAEVEEREHLFSELVDQFSIAAQSWAYQTLGDFHAAQDAAQEAFITAYENLDSLRDAEAFPAWLRRIVMTHSHRQQRGSLTIVAFDEDSLPSGNDLSTVVEKRLLHVQVRESVSDLPEHERVVTEMFYLEGYSQQEVAEALGLPLTTVKKRLQRAREHLREVMAPVSRLNSSLFMRAA
ncbi:MAG: RNA polymerase sigma factor [Anaerolineae bacterium]|nr:RNA polymerase sigma factor [Anaerolineae bacterium]